MEQEVQVQPINHWFLTEQQFLTFLRVPPIFKNDKRLVILTQWDGWALTINVI